MIADSRVGFKQKNSLGVNLYFQIATWHDLPVTKLYRRDLFLAEHESHKKHYQ